MSKAEKAVEYKHSGYNCAQAVLAAYADELSLDDDTLKAMGAAFGVGMGTFEATCGALCAAQMILGLKKYMGRPILSDAKEVCHEFKDLCGSIKCSELKGIETGKMLCSCDDCVRNAVKVLEQHINKESDPK